MKDENIIDCLGNKFTHKFLAVELTNSCNLHCPLCSTGSGYDKRPKGIMKFKEFKNFLDQCAPLLHMIGFIGSGEPTLHPKFIKFIEYAAKKKNKMTICCTNGTQLKKPDVIVKSGLQVIYVDVDGLTQEQHQRYRVGANLQTVLNNIKNLVQAKKKYRSSYPQIFIDTLIHRYNETDYERFIETARKLGVQGIRFDTIKDDLYQTEDLLPTREPFKHVKRNAAEYTCSFKETLVGILSWNGDIQLCCMTPHQKPPIVKFNAFQEKNILERMNSEEFYNMTKKAGDYPFCETCFLKVYASYKETITFQ
ncbi:MAG: radical SAM protein [Acidobacteria bacterium]|jgi:MoaA/NifB/PqqE/SkfB family radical SAM enzyme|nr:radical SAM protein [Acidobacteriota bacterium]